MRGTHDERKHQCLEKIEREAERGDATDHPLGRRQTRGGGRNGRTLATIFEVKEEIRFTRPFA